MEDNHGEKRPAAQQTSLLEGVRALLVDVEGVTTPLGYVKDTLNSYAKNNLKDYLEANFTNEQTLSSIESLRKQAADEKEEGSAIPPSSASKEEVIDAVVAKVTPKLGDSVTNDAVRSLQELVVEEGYKQEKLIGQVYEDVAPLLQMLVSEGIKVFSCSSESETSQRLLFSFSSQGDMLELFSGHFESKEKASKENFVSLAEKMEHPASEILYLCLNASDARFAHAAGYKTCVVVRETNDPSAEDQLNDCNVIYSLEELWDEYSGHDVPLKRLHPDYFGEYSTDGATNDSEAVTGEEEPDEPYGHAYDEPAEGTGEEENGDSQDA